MHVFSAKKYVTASIHTLKVLNLEQSLLIEFNFSLFEISQLKEDSQTQNPGDMHVKCILNRLPNAETTFKAFKGIVVLLLAFFYILNYFCKKQN